MCQYPTLYQIARKKSDTLANMLRSVPLNISFRRAIVGKNLALWHNLVGRLAHISFTSEKDRLKWTLTPYGVFTVRSMYRALINNGIVFNNKFIWKLKLPFKVKIFVWCLLKGVVLTKDNLVKRNWQEDLSCCSCHKNKFIRHLFLDCHLAQSVWNIMYLATGKTQSIVH